MYSTISQNLTWPVMKADMEIWVKKFLKWQKNKKTTNRTYENTPFHEPELLPCSTTNIELVGLWTVFFKNYDWNNIKKITSSLTAVESDTSWTEIIYNEDKSTANVRRLIEYNWLQPHQWTDKVAHDNVTDFIGCEFKRLLETYGIDPKLTTVNNPRSNKIAERTHLTMGDITSTVNSKGLNWQ